MVVQDAKSWLGYLADHTSHTPHFDREGHQTLPVQKIQCRGNLPKLNLSKQLIFLFHKLGNDDLGRNRVRS